MFRYALISAVFLILSPFVNPAEKLQRPNRILSVADEIVHDGEPSFHQQLFKSMKPYFLGTGREHKARFP